MQSLSTFFSFCDKLAILVAFMIAFLAFMSQPVLVTYGHIFVSMKKSGFLRVRSTVCARLNQSSAQLRNFGIAFSDKTNQQNYELFK
jgi:hypothetical protein